MISILLTMTDDFATLKQEIKRWEETHGKLPAIIVGHKNLVYSCTNDPDLREDRKSQVLYRNIPILTIDELWDMHAEQLGFDKWVNDDEDET